MLTPARAAALFRRVADPAQAHLLAAEVLGWAPLCGGMYDAGGVCVGIAPGGAGGLNPAWELEVAPADFMATARRACELLGRAWDDAAGSVLYDARGRSLSFHHAGGGVTTLVEPSWRARAGRSGRRLGQLLDGAAGGAAVVGVTLHVSSLPRSLRVYRDLLGLPPLRVTPREARLDAGPLILTLRAERELGMVADAARRGALGDALAFHAPGPIPADPDGHPLLAVPGSTFTQAPERSGTRIDLEVR